MCEANIEGLQTARETSEEEAVEEEGEEEGGVVKVCVI
jgi:hypothetical protein